MDWISDPLDRLQWALWHFVATIFWAVDRLVLMGAVLIHTLRKWITNPGGIIDLVMSSMLQGEQALSLKTFMAGAILLALMLAAFVFILRPIIGRGHSPVDLRKVFLWLALAGYLFSTGGAFFTSLEQFRSQLSSSAYQIAASVNGSVGQGGYNNTQGEVPLNSSEPFSPTVQLFPNTTHVYQGTQEYTGIDVAAAYMFATQEDVNGTNNGGTGLPAGFEDQYFVNDGVSPWPSNYNADQRQAALNRAVTGVIRVGTGIVPSVFAIQQAIIFLALAIAAAIIIFSLPIALVFAFFTATEVITLSVLRAYISLLVKTYVTAMILAIFMGFLKFWADSQNWVAFLGMSLLITYFTFQLAHMAVQTITQSLNVVTQAIGQATGTHAMYFDPINMTGQAAGLAATVGLAAATGGTSLAAGALLTGASEIGMNVPGMRTLGFGMAMRTRRPGQYASNALKETNADAGQATATPQQQVNNYLQANGISPIQPDHSSGSAVPSAPLPPTIPLSAHPSGVKSPQSANGSAATAPATQLLALPSGGNNGHRQGGNGKAETGGNRQPSDSKIPVGDPLGIPHVQRSASSDFTAQGPTEQQGQATALSEDSFDEPAPVLEGFAQMPAYVRLRTGAGRDASIGTAIMDLVTRRDGTPDPGLPAQLGNLPARSQIALQEIAKRGHRPDEVQAVIGAVNSVMSRLQAQNIPSANLTRYFLSKQGTLDMESRGVREVLRDLGPAGKAWMSDVQRRADLSQLVGAAAQFEKTYHAGDIRAAVGRAVEHGGSAESAADSLGVSPGAAWGGRYGSVESAISRSPLFGLDSGEAVQRFVGLAQKHSLDDLVSGQVKGLSPEQQALLDGVRAKAAEIATDETGDHNDAAAETVLLRYLRDVRSIPARITAPVVPVAPLAQEDSESKGTSLTPKEKRG